MGDDTMHTAQVLTPARRRRRRGWSLIDVAVAFALLAFVFVGAARFIISLAHSSEVSVTRTAARREIGLAKELLAADFAQPASCGPGVATSHFGAFGVAASGGETSFSLYVDVDLDGDTDLVGWRISGGALQRATQLSAGTPCDQLTLVGASWKTVLQPVRAASGVNGYFTLIRGGFPTAIAGECISDKLDCRADGMRVAFTTSVGESSGPVGFDTVYRVPGDGL